MEVIMTREQARQKLISFGVEEPTDEQISDLLNSINAETKKEKDRADGYKAKADKADELQSQIDELNSQNMTEVEIMHTKGFFRCYDSGNLKFHYCIC